MVAFHNEQSAPESTTDGNEQNNDSSSNNVRLMFEDYSGSGGIAGDVYFDNIQLKAVPLPAAIWFFTPAVLGLLGVGTKRRIGYRK